MGPPRELCPPNSHIRTFHVKNGEVLGVPGMCAGEPARLRLRAHSGAPLEALHMLQQKPALLAGHRCAPPGRGPQPCSRCLRACVCRAVPRHELSRAPPKSSCLNGAAGPAGVPTMVPRARLLPQWILLRPGRPQRNGHSGKHG